MLEGKKAILLVEDEVFIALSEKTALERRGYATMLAPDGEKAVAMARAEPGLDLVLMDIDLGRGMDGTEAARLILAGRDIPVVFLSSHTEPEVVERTESITSYGYVVKNSGITVLDASIKMAFRLHEARRKEREKDEALNASLRTSADIVRRIPSGLFIYRFEPPDRLYLEDGNPQAERMTGIGMAEWRGREFNEIWPEARRLGITERYLEVLATGRPYEPDEVPYGDGRLAGYFHIHAFALPMGRLAVAFEDITERRRVEDRLRESEAFHRRVIENALDGFWVIDTAGRFLQVNESYRAMSGYGEEELLGMRISDVEANESPAETEAHMARLLAAGRERFETRHRRKDGAVREFEVSAHVDATGDGRVFAFLRDVTARREAERALRLSEERLRLANKATNDVIWDWDVATDTQRWNEAGRSVFGWDEIVDRPVPAGWWVERVHPEDRGRVERGFFAKVGDPHASSWSDEYRFRRADGGYAVVMDRGYLLRDGDGTAIRMIGAMLDISERRAAERRAEESAELFRQVAENVREVLWLGSPDWSVIHYISPAYAAIWGREPEELYRRPLAWLESVVEEDRGKVEQAIPRDPAAVAEPILFPDYRIRRPDGSQAWISARAFPILDSRGAVFRIAGIAEDITERKRGEELVRLRLGEKETLLREVHHRIKNNLGSVIALLDSQAGEVEDPVARERLREAATRVEGMRQVYEKLLRSDDYADLSSRAYLVDLSTSVMRLFGEPLGITLTTEIEDFPLGVRSAFPLGTIVNELLTNSIKYAFTGRESGRVSVSLARREGRAELLVADDGVGLPAGFDPSVSGGLGLVLVRMLTEQLGGRLTLEGGPRGTRARVEFPG